MCAAVYEVCGGSPSPPAGEIVQLSDVDATSRLVESYARSLGDDDSFLR